MTPVLSIIIPCYNLGQYLQEAIESVELHANKNIFEIVIVNDGSTEEYTITILAELESNKAPIPTDFDPSTLAEHP